MMSINTRWERDDFIAYMIIKTDWWRNGVMTIEESEDVVSSVMIERKY